MRLHAVDAEQMPATSFNAERAELEHFYAMAPIALGLVDREFRFVRVSERLAAINGRSIREHTGRTIREVLPEIAPKVEPLLRQVIDTGEPLLDVEIFGTARSEPGAGKYWLASYYPLKSNQETVWAVSLVVQDITERKLAELRLREETALRESEERFRLLADAAPVMIWMSGPDKACTYFNKGWLEYTGRPMERELGDGWAEGVHPHDFQRCLHTYCEAFDARRDFQMEYRLRRHDGKYRWIWDIGVPRFEADGRFAGYIGSCIDITERKRAAEDLHKSEALNRAVLASLFAHVAIIDRDGTILGVNEPWNRFACDNGADPSASVSAGANYVEVCRRAARDPDETARQALAGIEAVLDGSRERFALEYACNSPSEERWFEMTVEPLRRPGGGAVISHVDITKRKRAEAAVERHRQELAHVTRVAAMGELAASLAHELNQPLTAILSNAQAACRLLAANPPDLEEVRAILPDIVEDDKRAGEVIRRLRALLKKGEVQFKPLDLNHLIREVVHIAHSDAVAKKVGVTFDLDPDLPPVRGDQVQLQQVVLNLILNAFEAMKEGPPNDRKLVIRTICSKKEIVLFSSKGQSPFPNADAQTVLVSVRDSGTGIAEDKLARVFDTFYTTKPEGLGMGLAISRSIVEAHGGRIWAANNSDGGAIFRFTLPLISDC